MPTDLPPDYKPAKPEDPVQPGARPSDPTGGIDDVPGSGYRPRRGDGYPGPEGDSVDPAGPGSVPGSSDLPGGIPAPAATPTF